MTKSVAPRNAITRDDFLSLEKIHGGPSETARVAGVHRSTWWRWREGRLDLRPRDQKLIAMMLQTSRKAFQG